MIGSYLAIAAVIVLTGMGLPIPEEVPIIAAGVLSSHGQLYPWAAFAACLTGALLGDCASYWIGFHFGRRVVREHHWWARFVTPEREQTIEKMIDAHGFKVFLLARFLVGLRSAIYLTAGILRMPFRKFILIDLFCASMVIGIVFGLSYEFGEVVTGWIRRTEWAVTGVVVVVLLSVGALLWYRHRKRMALKAQSSEASSAPGTDAQEEQEESENQADAEAERKHAG